MTTMIVFNSDEEIVLLYSITSNKYIYLADSLRSYIKDKPLDLAAFRQQARSFTFYKSKGEQSEPEEITGRLAYSFLGLSTIK